MIPDCQSLHVLEHEVPCVQLHREAHEFRQEAIPRIVKCAMSNQRKALARRTAEYHVDWGVFESGRLSYSLAGDFRGVRANDSAIRKVEFVHCAVYGVNFDCGGHVEAGLLKAERQPSRTSKQVDSDRPLRSLFVFSSRGSHSAAPSVSGISSARTATP